MLVQINKRVVVCGSDLQRGNSGDGCLSSSILFKYESGRGHLFVLIWARVRRVALTAPSVATCDRAPGECCCHNQVRCQIIQSSCRRGSIRYVE